MKQKKTPPFSFRIKRWWQGYEWPVIIGLGVAAIIIGCFGFNKHLGPNSDHSVAGILYRVLQLFFVDSGFLDGIDPPVGWEINVARFLAPFTLTYTAFQALAVIFAEQIKTLRLLRLKDHAIICGLGGKGQLIAKQFLEAGIKVIIIEQDDENDFVRQLREEGAIVFFGDATDSGLLMKVRVHTANYLICVCGDDGINTEIAVRAQKLCEQKKSGQLKCITHIVDPKLCELLENYEKKTSGACTFSLDFFNIYERGAKALLTEHPATGNILIVGFGRMGSELLFTIAGSTESKTDIAHPMQISVIDRDAKNKIRSWCMRYPQFSNACHIHAINMDVTTCDYEKATFLFNDEGKCIINKIYICFDDDSFGLTAALKLHHHLEGKHVPIIVRMNHDFGLANLLHSKESAGFENLYAFGLLERTCRLERILSDES